MKIQLAANWGQLSVAYSGSTFTVALVEIRGSVTVVVQSSNTTLYIGLGVGVGAGILLLVLTAVVLGTVIYVYRRSVCGWGCHSNTVMAL